MALVGFELKTLVSEPVVTCWLLYRRDCKSLGLPANNHLALMNFKNSISLALLKESQVVSAAKRGRPSLSVESTYTEKRRKGHNTKIIPQQSIRHDNIDHFPVYKDKRERCKLPGCKSTSYIYCQKCELYLCIDKSKNCFWKFHKE